jgi:hypothetical protein
MFEDSYDPAKMPVECQRGVGPENCLLATFLNNMLTVAPRDICCVTLQGFAKHRYGVLEMLHTPFVRIQVWIETVY